MPVPQPRGFVEVCALQVPAAGSSSSKVGGNAADQVSSSGCAAVWCGLVRTAGVDAALEAAALALCSGAPVVLEGPAGSGKTSLLRALALATGASESALWLHLDDNTDAKSLLGGYACGAVPGEFIWQPGPLARAVAEGRWVIVEGVDAAPPDVLAALLPLIESGVLHVPARGQSIQAAPGFQVLGTCTTTAAGSSSSSSAQDVLGGAWARVRLEAPSEEEQRAVLAELHPTVAPLLPLAQAAVRVVQMAGGHHLAVTSSTANDSAAAAAGTTAPGSVWTEDTAIAALQATGLRYGELSLSLSRHFNTRDLVKWCGRMASVHSSLLSRCLRAQQQLCGPKGAPVGRGVVSKCSSQTRTPPDTAELACSAAAAVGVDLGRIDLELRRAAFTETADLFAGLVSRHQAKLRLLAALAALWGLPAPHDAAAEYEELSKPNMHLGGGELTVRFMFLADRTAMRGCFALLQHAHLCAWVRMPPCQPPPPLMLACQQGRLAAVMCSPHC